MMTAVDSMYNVNLKSTWTNAVNDSNYTSNNIPAIQPPQQQFGSPKAEPIQGEYGVSGRVENAGLNCQVEGQNISVPTEAMNAVSKHAGELAQGIFKLFNPVDGQNAENDQQYDQKLVVNAPVPMAPTFG